jgi:hypothetical protein
LTASPSKPFLLLVFGRASASAGGEAEVEALPKGAIVREAGLQVGSGREY